MVLFTCEDCGHEWAGNPDEDGECPACGSDAVLYTEYDPEEVAL